MTENIDRDSGSGVASHQKLGLLTVAFVFAVAVAAGLGFLAVYWTGGNNMLLGGTLALFFGGLGAALVLWAHLLASHKEETGPRETHASEEPDREAVSQDFFGSGKPAQRRKMLKGLLAGGVGLMAAIFVSLMRSLGESPEPSLMDTIWKHGQRLMTWDAKPITLDSLQPGSSIVVFPEGKIGSERAQTVLIRVHEEYLQLPRNRANWAPNGYVAYSRVCTHAGCPVGLFEATVDLLLCPCHQSSFNVLRAAQPTGGPAARPLPQLPLYADADGTLRARGGFTAPPGPGFWGMP